MHHFFMNCWESVEIQLYKVAISIELLRMIVVFTTECFVDKIKIEPNTHF